MLGARPLRRTIQREIEDSLSEKILYGELKAGEFVLVDATGEDRDSVFTFAGSLRREALPDIPDVPPVDTVGGGPQDAASATG